MFFDREGKARNGIVFLNRMKGKEKTILSSRSNVFDRWYVQIPPVIDTRTRLKEKTWQVLRTWEFSRIGKSNG